MIERFMLKSFSCWDFPLVPWSVKFHFTQSCHGLLFVRLVGFRLLAQKKKNAWARLTPFILLKKRKKEKEKKKPKCMYG